jgi:diguanylate cyclase (GGDEF)-like protein
MNEYRSRVEAAERAAELDQLTGLGNRRAFEKQLSARLNAVQNFSLIMIDINDFKMMNDRHGHLAGDDLLRQFATELHAHLLPLETACRWGGDEFALLIPGGDKPGGEKEDMQRVDQLRQWVLGEYRIDTGNEKVKTVVTASFGVAHWDGKESGIELVARADQGMYRDKEATSAAIASEPPE